MSSLSELRWHAEPLILAWMSLLLPVGPALVLATVGRRTVPLWASILWALLLTLAGLGLGHELLSRVLPMALGPAWLLCTGLVGASAATALALPPRESEPGPGWRRAAVVLLCGAPGLIERALAVRPALELGWLVALLALAWASARPGVLGPVARRDAGALLAGAALGAYAAGLSGPLMAASFLLAGLVGGWPLRGFEGAAVPALALAVYAGNVEWLLKVPGSPLETELYAKVLGPLPEGRDLAGRRALDRDWSGLPRSWLGMPLSGTLDRAILAAGHRSMDELMGAPPSFSLAAQEGGEVFDVRFDQGAGVLVERLEDGRIGLAGLPARSSWRQLHEDLRAAWQGCKAGHGGVMLDPTQGWTVQEAVSVCISARNLISPEATCALSSQRTPGCVYEPATGWHPVCWSHCRGETAQTWEVRGSAMLRLRPVDEAPGAVRCPEGGCTVALTEPGAVALDCPGGGCTVRCGAQSAQRRGDLYRCDTVEERPSVDLFGRSSP